MNMTLTLVFIDIFWVFFKNEETMVMVMVMVVVGSGTILKLILFKHFSIFRYMYLTITGQRQSEYLWLIPELKGIMYNYIYFAFGR